MEEKSDTAVGAKRQEADAASCTHTATRSPDKPDGFRPSGFPNAVDYLVFFGIFFVAQFIGFAAGWLVTGLPDKTLLGSADDAVRTAEQLLAARYNALSFFVTMALALGGFLLYRRLRGGPRTVARFSKRGFDPVLLLWGIVLMVAAGAVLEPLLKWLPAIPDIYGRGAWSLLSVVVMAPLFEELLFRGAILESTRARYGVVAAWFVPALIFGIAHRHPTLAVNAFVMGLILGYIYIRSDSLWSTLILHAVNNALAYVLMVAGPEKGMLSGLTGSPALFAAVYLAALAVFAVSGYMVYRTLQRLRTEEKNRQQA